MACCAAGVLGANDGAPDAINSRATANADAADTLSNDLAADKASASVEQLKVVLLTAAIATHRAGVHCITDAG
jgi:hypothetical protein